MSKQKHLTEYLILYTWHWKCIYTPLNNQWLKQCDVRFYFSIKYINKASAGDGRSMCTYSLPHTHTHKCVGYKHTKRHTIPSANSVERRRKKKKKRIKLWKLQPFVEKTDVSVGLILEYPASHMIINRAIFFSNSLYMHVDKSVTVQQFSQLHRFLNNEQHHKQATRNEQTKVLWTFKPADFFQYYTFSITVTFLKRNASNSFVLCVSENNPVIAKQIKLNTPSKQKEKIKPFFFFKHKNRYLSIPIAHERVKIKLSLTALDT